MQYQGSRQELKWDIARVKDSIVLSGGKAKVRVGSRQKNMVRKISQVVTVI